MCSDLHIRYVKDTSYKPSGPVYFGSLWLMHSDADPHRYAGKWSMVKQQLVHLGRCGQWRTQGELASGGSRMSIRDVNVNTEALNSQYCQTGAVLIFWFKLWTLLIVAGNLQSPLTSSWPHLRCDVSLEEGDYKWKLSLCYSIVYYYNGAQRYEQFLQVGWLYQALILLGLALSFFQAHLCFRS